MNRVTGRAISPGKARGKAVVLDEDFGFLGGVDPASGDLQVPPHANITDKIMVFPRGKGSTVGSFTMYDLKVKGKAPAAIINEEAETIVATGAVISSIPLVDKIDLSLIKDGDLIEVDGDKGEIAFPELGTKGVVTSILVRDGKALLLKRSPEVGIFPGRWSWLTGTMEEGESPLETAQREIFEETGLKVGVPIRRAESYLARNDDVIWTVYPMLFSVEEGEPCLNWESTDCAWVLEEDLADRDTVPGVERPHLDLEVWGP